MSFNQTARPTTQDQNLGHHVGLICFAIAMTAATIAGNTDLALMWLGVLAVFVIIGGVR